MKIRINNVEVRPVSSSTYSYEFIVWQPNKYYGKRDEMIEEEGYQVINEGNGKWSLKHPEWNSYISMSCFEGKETCYVFAWLKEEKEGYDLITVGDRLLDLPKPLRNDFFDVYSLLIDRIKDKDIEE